MQRAVCSAQEPIGRDLQSAGAATTISQSPAVQELLKEVQQVESQLAIDQSLGRPSYDSLPQSKKADLQRLLQERVKRVLQIRDKL